MTELVLTFPAGKPVIDVTSITLANNTAKTQDKTVPTGKKWVLQTIRLTNPDDVNRSCTIDVYKEAAKTNLVQRLLQITVNASDPMQWPHNYTDANSKINQGGYNGQWVLGEGTTISVTWAAGGASAGGTDADGLVLWYRELDA